MFSKYPYIWFWMTALFFVFLASQFPAILLIDLYFFNTFIEVVPAKLLVFFFAANSLVYGLIYWALKKRQISQWITLMQLLCTILNAIGMIFYLKIWISIQPMYENIPGLRPNFQLRDNLLVIIPIVFVLGLIFFAINIITAFSNQKPPSPNKQLQADKPLDHHLQQQVFDEE